MGPGDEGRSIWERIEDRTDSGESFTDAAWEEGLSRDEALSHQDEYDPDPEVQAYIDELDGSPSNTDLGLDRDGGRDDD